MKINICDVCYYENGNTVAMKDRKVIPSRYKISYKNGKGMRIALDTCEEHKNYFKTEKTFDAAYAKYQALFGFNKEARS